MKKDFIFLAVITILYMTAQYYARGYFALGAEILFVPFGSFLILAKWKSKEEKDENNK